ncbi:MAG: response regulator transcription factor [Chloroflexota bacterium]
MRILVVEDEPRMAATLGEGLREAGYTVDIAVDGAEGLDYLSTVPYDAVLLDVQLPKLDGFEVCRQMRAKGLLTPVLMLTARDTTADKIHGLDSGGDDYLTKPFAFDEMLARLRALLRRGSAQRDPRLQVSDLSLDPAARLVDRGGREIALTRREYAILETLMRRPGWIVSRDELIESVWGFDFPDESNLVEVYVGRLRKRLGPPPLIHTVRGIGYRMQPGES